MKTKGISYLPGSGWVKSSYHLILQGTSGTYDGSRCRRFWPFGNPPSLQYGAMAGQGRAAKRSLSRRSLWRRRIGTGAQRCRWPKDTQPIRAAAVGTYGGVASLVTAAKPRTAQRSLAAHGWGCSSLAPCHMSQLPFARPIIVSGRALKYLRKERMLGGALKKLL